MTSGNLSTQMYSVFCRGPVSMSALCNVSLYTKRQKTVCHQVSTHRNPARAEWTDTRRQTGIRHSGGHIAVTSQHQLALANVSWVQQNNCGRGALNAS